MSSVRKDLIKLTQDIILDHFLQIETEDRAPSREFLQLAQYILRNQTWFRYALGRKSIVF